MCLRSNASLNQQRKRSFVGCQESFLPELLDLAHHGAAVDAEVVRERDIGRVNVLLPDSLRRVSK